MPVVRLTSAATSRLGAETTSMEHQCRDRDIDGASMSLLAAR
jgi:hypothetical protein